MKKKEKLGLNQFLSNAETAKGSMQKFSGQTSIFDIDYSEFEITNEEKEELIDCEHNISQHLQDITKHTIYYYDALYKANKIFSSHDKTKGYWRKWLSKINILKDKANMVVRKYALYLESKNKGIENPQILELPEVAVKKLTGSEKDVFAESEIIEIVSASNPTKAFKNIEIKKNNERMSSREERKNYLKKELTRIETKIKKLQEKKKKIKEEYKNL